MGLEDHADIISSISNGQCDRVLLGGFDQLHNLETQRRHQQLLHHFDVCVSTGTPILFGAVCLYLRFLEWRHSTAEHGAAVAADFEEDLFVVP